ncbi:hypothetical protein EI94DRAFT_762583 [Lactarius quietus]|nr:hypothetical protein EI94DRAFT_762583 [Lactarius quietus]
MQSPRRYRTRRSVVVVAIVVTVVTQVVTLLSPLSPRRHQDSSCIMAVVEVISLSLNRESSRPRCRQRVVILAVGRYRRYCLRRFIVPVISHPLRCRSRRFCCRGHFIVLSPLAMVEGLDSHRPDALILGVLTTAWPITSQAFDDKGTGKLSSCTSVCTSSPPKRIEGGTEGTDPRHPTS